MQWTELEDDRLKEGLEAGLSFGLVAAQIGRTKNSCLSRARVLGVKSRYAPGWDQPRSRKSKEKKPVIPIKTGPWSAHEVNTVRKLREAGMMVAEIAAQIYRTVEATRGVLRRHDIRPPEDHAATIQQRLAARKATCVPVAAPKAPTVGDLVFGPGVSLIDLQPRQCRWPVGESDFVFCAAERLSGSQYCPIHHGLAWSGRKATPQERRAVERSVRKALVGGIRA